MTLSDKVPRQAGFANCFLSVPVVCVCTPSKLPSALLASWKKVCAISTYKVFCHLVYVVNVRTAASTPVT